MKLTKSKIAKTASQAALASMIAATALLSGCGSSQAGDNDYVQCMGVSKLGNNVPVVMPKGLCEKLADSSAVPFSLNDYVECYGVAGAGKNDCATNTSACGGSVSVDRSPAAWLAMPRGICTQLNGSIVGAITSANTKQTVNSKTTAPAITQSSSAS